MTREQWLELLVAERLNDHFKAQGYEIPKTRVSTGFPSKGGLANKKRTIGQYWCPTSTDDGIGQTFISPTISDSIEVGATLAHELVHAAVGVAVGHGKVFKKCALSIGLEGKMTATVAGPTVTLLLQEFIEKHGQYPHRKLEGSHSGPKKDGTRLLKAVCPSCDLVVRITKKHAGKVGCVTCGDVLVTEGMSESEETQEAV